MQRIFLILGLFWGQAAWAGIVTEVIEYQVGDVTLSGYLAYDDANAKTRPGVLVVHEWWGHNAYARKRAHMLAELGYTAFALDMYGKGKLAAHPKDAQAFMQAVMGSMDVAQARFDAAHQVLSAHATVDKKHIAAIGYCFGGGVVLNMARLNKPLQGVVSFHGSLAGAVPSTTVVPKILVFNGAADPFVSKAQITAFKKEMCDAKADFTFVDFPGVKHSFTNPEADVFGGKFNMPLAYNAQADKASWAQMQRFFKRIFSQ